MSSIAFVGSTGAVVSTAATSIALSNPTGTANDDVLIVTVALNKSSEPGTPVHSAPAGWTQIGSTTHDDNILSVSLWWKRWQTGDPTSHTFTSTITGKWAGAIATYSGVHTTAAIHAQAIAIEGVLGVTHASPAVTTSVSTWLINVFSDSVGSTWTPPSGEMEREDRKTSGTTSADVSVEFCDSNGDRASGSQDAKTATASGASGIAVMAQIALEPAPSGGTGGGTRTSKARIFRSTQTSPNAGTVRDLTTAFGTTANAATSAQYAAAGTATWKRWNPNSATATNQDPAGVSTASGQGWRDTVAENASEQVIVNAGTWTTRVRLTKTGQTLAADITVRVTVIVYRVNSSGTHQQEIGRVQMADTTLSTATLTLSGSFTTTSDTTFATGDKVQVECYVTPITAGVPTAPAAAVNVNFVVDETSANSGASLTAIPPYRIVYTRTPETPESAPASEVTTRAFAAVRSPAAELAPASDVLTRVALFPRATPDSAPAADVLARSFVGWRSLPDSASANDAISRAAIAARSLADAASAVDALARSTIAARSTSDAASASDVLTKFAFFPRATSDTALASDALARSAILARALADTASASDALARLHNNVRSIAESAGAVDSVVRATTLARALADTASAAEALTRVLVQARSLVDSASVADALARSSIVARALADAAAAVDSLARVALFPRAFTDTAGATDSISRYASQARVLADSAPASDVVGRVVLAARGPSDLAAAVDSLLRATTAARSLLDNAPASDVLAASKIMQRALADVASASDSLVRQLTNVRTVRDNIGPDPTDIVDFPTKVLAGVVRNSSGTPVSGATVKLFRQSDDRAVKVATSAADGSYSFARDRFDLEVYYVVSYLGGTPQTQGISERDLQPV